MSASPALSPFRKELGETVRLAVPLAAANLLQMAVYAIDVIFVARLGQEALAASSLAVALFGTLMFGLTGLTTAVAPLIAAERGRRENAVREIRRSVRMALWIAFGTGLAGMGVCFAGEAIMLATGQSQVLAERAGSYIFIIAFGLIPMIVGNVMRIFVSAMGRPMFATVITALALLVNALGNWVLIFGNLGAPALGLEGSAVASVLTALFTVLAFVIAIRRDRRLRRFHVFGRWWNPEWERLVQILKIGIPIALTVTAEGGLFSAAAFLMGRIGEAELAAHTIALQVAAAFFQVPFGIGQAATIRVGYHYGARNAEAVGLAGRAALLVAVAFMTVSAGSMILVPKTIMSLYVDVTAPANAAMVVFAAQYLAIAAAFQLFDGVQAVAAGALRGLQDTRVPAIIAVTAYWLAGFSTAAWLGLATPLDGAGVWTGLAVGLVIAAALLLHRWRARQRFSGLALRN
jgi:MATE family multidrug resistance protein